MKIILMILISTCLSLANSEYPRFKRKGMVQNGPPRPPPPPSQFGKKWSKPPQKMPPQFGQKRPFQGPPQPLRGNRPIPQFNNVRVPGINMHMAQPHLSFNGPKIHKFPMQHGKPPAPVKEFFKGPIHQPPKNTNFPQNIQFPQENKIIPKITHYEKQSFVSSHSVPTAVEYDYHVQTNNIPMSINTIKQVGEKGPIHTIPAPNLTPADMPSNIEYSKPHTYYPQQEVRIQQTQYLNEKPQATHQYQVTEENEQPKQLYRDQINAQTHYPVQMTQIDQHSNTYQNIQSAFYNPNNLGLNMQETGNHGVNIGFTQAENDQEDMLLSNSKHYQVVDEHFPIGQNNQNLYTQAIHSSFDQQQPKVMSQFVQQQQQQQQPDYLQQYERENNQDSEVQPEYHSFNYDEQAHQAQAKSGQSSESVSATYSLGIPEVVKREGINSRSSSVDPLTQTKIVQSYFGARTDNNVEPDAKPSGNGSTMKDLANTSFFSSLPNKEVADRLAKLQAAGKINSSLMQMGNKKNSEKDKDEERTSIYVTEDDKEQNSKEQSVEYEDYSEEEPPQSDEKNEFGLKKKY